MGGKITRKHIDKLSYAVCEFVAQLDEACLDKVEGWKPLNVGLDLKIKHNGYVEVHPVNWPSESFISCRVLPYSYGQRVGEARIIAKHLSFSVSVNVDWNYTILVRGTQKVLSEACSEIQKNLMQKN